MQGLEPGGRMFWVNSRHTCACHVGWRSAVFWSTIWMEGERGGRRDGWLKGSGWTVPSPTPGAGQHLPGLVQTLPNPYFTSLLLPV